jgi:hypothetical protein
LQVFSPLLVRPKIRAAIQVSICTSVLAKEVN